MEPTSKNKSKITGHFRVALKPTNIENNGPSFKKLKTKHDFGKENKIVELITIEDDKDTENLSLAACGNATNKTRKSSSQPAPTLHDRLSPRLKASRLDLCHLNRYKTPLGLKSNVFDFDRSLLSNVIYEPHYAWDSFNYDRQQEVKFKNRNYLNDDCHRNNHITAQSRAKQIDWVVIMQDYFNLCNDLIYMAVKLADQYLMRKAISSKNQQLLYVTAIMISTKFEDRQRDQRVDLASLIQEIGGIYSREQVISFEIDILKTLNFNIRFPLAIGFLRRFARCTLSGKKRENLSRYILELSLLDDEMIETLESKLAAASLLLAFRMVHQQKGGSVECDSKCCWNESAQYYTGYSVKELTPLVTKLNLLISKPSKDITAIKDKYSHQIWMAVAEKIPPLTCK